MTLHITDVDKFIIRKLEDMYIYPKFKVGADVALNSSIEALSNKVIVVSNEEDNTSIVASAEDRNSINKIGLLQLVESVEADNIAQAQNIANNTLKENNKPKRETTLNLLMLDGANTIKSNRLIELNVGKLKGWYKIKSASHTLASGQHMVSISIDW